KPAVSRQRSAAPYRHPPQAFVRPLQNAGFPRLYISPERFAFLRDSISASPKDHRKAIARIVPCFLLLHLSFRLHTDDGQGRIKSTLPHEKARTLFLELFFHLGVQ